MDLCTSTCFTYRRVSHKKLILSFIHRIRIPAQLSGKKSLSALATEAKTQQIIKAIIAVAHALNALVVAEGVETKAQVDFLTENGCDRLQGYYFSKPVPPEEIYPLLKSNPTLWKHLI